MDLVENFLLTTRLSFSRGVWLQRLEARGCLSGLTRDFEIQPPNVDATAGQLSGGNLQKLVLAREFYRQPRIIVAEQPTQGLDVAATEEVWKLLLEARQNAGILLITGDLAEALALCDRVAVMFGGRVVDTFPTTDTARVARIGSMMAGLESTEETPAD
jgi:simple sugar transport system ATP-binding protein